MRTVFDDEEDGVRERLKEDEGREEGPGDALRRLGDFERIADLGCELEDEPDEVKTVDALAYGRRAREESRRCMCL